MHVGTNIAVGVRAKPVLDGPGRVGPSSGGAAAASVSASAPRCGPTSSAGSRCPSTGGRPGDRLHPVRARHLGHLPERRPVPAYEGEFYRFRLMNPFFDPGPHRPSRHPCLPRRGERADVPGRGRGRGRVPRASHALRRLSPGRGAARDRRGRAGERQGRIRPLELYAPVLTVTGETEAERSASEQEVRRQIAFYASTPSYRALLEYHGVGGIAKELSALMRQGELGAMPRLVPDALLEEVAIAVPPAEVPARAAPALRRAPGPGFALLPGSGRRPRGEVAGLRRLVPGRRLRVCRGDHDASADRARGAAFPGKPPPSSPVAEGQGLPLTWAEFAVRVRRRRAPFARSGVGAGDRFAILCRNDPAPGRAHPCRVLDGRDPRPDQLPPRTGGDRGPPRRALPAPRRGWKTTGRALFADPAIARRGDRMLRIGRGAGGGGARRARRARLRDAPRRIARGRGAGQRGGRRRASSSTPAAPPGGRRGCASPHRNIAANGLQLVGPYRAAEDDVMLHVAPMFHSADLLGSPFSHTGAAHAYLPDFAPDAFLAAVEKSRATLHHALSDPHRPARPGGGLRGLRHELFPAPDLRGGADGRGVDPPGRSRRSPGSSWSTATGSPRPPPS